MAKKSNKFVFVFFLIILIIVLLVLLFFNFRKEQYDIKEDERVLVIGMNNLVAVYEDKLAVKIPYGISLSKNETIANLVEKKNYEKILEEVNSIFPVKLDRYKVLKNVELNLNVKNYKNVPEINLDEERFILTFSLNSMFESLYIEKANVNEVNENIIVDVLNANGKGGYARKTGELINKEFSMKYNAANYETLLEESYLVLNDISNDKVEEIIMKLPEKYFKIKKTSFVPTLANLVVILGKEEKIDYKIEIEGEANTSEEIFKTLRKAGYKNLIKTSNNIKIDNNLIKYNKEDYYIAYKVSKALDIQNLMEDNSLKNKLLIILK